MQKKAYHINATSDDLKGNDGIGRYILLPGSDGRAHEIAEHFNNLHVKKHSRQHNLYLGTIKSDGKNIDVAAISTGIGCPSTEIIVHELFQLGAKRFLRIGTAGTFQPRKVRVGSIVNAQASVRDESTSRDYAPVELPAIASLEFVTSILVAAEKLKMEEEVHTGIVHCKGSLYGRELATGPRAAENEAYLNLLVESGVLATEMETATLFIQSQLYNHQLSQHGDTPEFRVLAGAILAMVGTMEPGDHLPEIEIVNANSVELALETIKILAIQELIG